MYLIIIFFRFNFTDVSRHYFKRLMTWIKCSHCSTHLLTILGRISEINVINYFLVYLFSVIPHTYLKWLLRQSKMFQNFLPFLSPLQGRSQKNYVLVCASFIRSIFSPISMLLGSIILAVLWLLVTQDKVFYI